MKNRNRKRRQEGRKERRKTKERERERNRKPGERRKKRDTLSTFLVSSFLRLFPCGFTNMLPASLYDR